jgi:hypothetical protein
MKVGEILNCKITKKVNLKDKLVSRNEIITKLNDKQVNLILDGDTVFRFQGCAQDWSARKHGCWTVRREICITAEACESHQNPSLY